MPNVNISFYINMKVCDACFLHGNVLKRRQVIESVHRALGIALGSGRGDSNQDDDIADETN